jgi:transcriptional regulator with XRE-family HTH domain
MQSMAEIGKTLREARMHARIDVSEIEEQTKIRAKYLRALENEEWGLLPGATYTKSFLRVYAETLGLDGRALVDEYKAAYEHSGDGERLETMRRGRPQGERSRDAGGEAPAVSRLAVLVGLGACVLIALALVGILTRGGGAKAPVSAPVVHRTGRHRARTHGQSSSRSGLPAVGHGTVSVSVRPTAKVWVCLVGEGGERLIPGVVISPGQARPLAYRGRSFEVNVGNAHVALLIDGRLQPVPVSSRPVGFAITAAGTTRLTGKHLPTCA